jgi:four helix bundle protein
MEADNKTGKAQGFEELTCYQLALKLLGAAYKLAVNVPDYEKYNLASQIRRAALSTVLNIAEGYGRYHYLDKLRFFYIARGSLSETRSAFIAAHTVGHIDDVQCQWACNVEAETQKSLNGYIDYIRRQQQGKKEFGHQVLKEDPVEYTLIPDSLIPDSLTPDSLIPDSLSPDSLSPDSLLPNS